MTGPVEGRYDVAIVGGGFTGLSAALSLAKGGARVALLEAGGDRRGIGPQWRAMQRGHGA
jgi:glycine/D-amino acid oxidase-like deaminating enzyme